MHRPDHWIFAGTGLERGGTFGGKETIVCYECDGCEFEMVEGLLRQECGSSSATAAQRQRVVGAVRAAMRLSARTVQ